MARSARVTSIVFARPVGDEVLQEMVQIVITWGVGGHSPQEQIALRLHGRRASTLEILEPGEDICPPTVVEISSSEEEADAFHCNASASPLRAMCVRDSNPPAKRPEK